MSLAIRNESTLKIDLHNQVPAVRDLDLAEFLGFERPRKIREIIERYLAVLPGIQVRPTVGRGRNQHGTTGHTYVVNEYWLDERSALFIASKSETAKASTITLAVIDAFLAFRSQLNEPARVRLELVNAPLIFSNPEQMEAARVEIRKTIDAVAGMTFERLSGAIRRHCNVTGPYRMTKLCWDLQVIPLLRSLRGGELKLLPSRTAHKAFGHEKTMDQRQLWLWSLAGLKRGDVQ